MCCHGRPALSSEEPSTAHIGRGPELRSNLCLAEWCGFSRFTRPDKAGPVDTRGTGAVYVTAKVHHLYH